MKQADALSIHPIANAIPAMTDEEFVELKASILANGLREPVTIFEGQIIDGRHRYRACAELGIPITTREMVGSPWRFVWDENAERRHLDKGTKAALWLSFEEGDEQWQKEHAEAKAGFNKSRSETSKGNSRACKSGTAKQNSRCHSVTTTVLGEPKTRNARARKAKVSPTLMAHAEVLKKNAPDLHLLVCCRKVTLTQAYRQWRERKRESKRSANAAKVSKVAAINEENGFGVFSTIAIDPPWDWGDEGDKNQLGRARPDYATKSIEEIAALPIQKIADENCHLYLWITNRSLPKGFKLIENWGFRYITCLTWVKPSYGMGNYFRGQTEHVLFGVKGSLPLKRKDVGTYFQGKRGGKQHAQKPDEFYALVESCSPGPYLEMFSRKRRPGWKHWGEDS